MESSRKNRILVAVMVASAALVMSGCDRFTSVQTRLDRASAALDKGNLPAALSDARAAAEKAAANPQVRLLLARISLKQGDVAGALAEIDRAHSQGITSDALVELKAEAELATGKAADVLQTLGAQPATARGQALLAQALFQSGSTAEARQQLDALLAREPQHPDALLLQARMQLATGNAAQAPATLDALLKASPDFARGWQLRAQLAAQAGDVKAAISALEQAQKSAMAQMSFPEQWSMRAMLAQLQLDTGDTTGAATQIEALRKSAPESVLTELLRARLLLAQKDVNGAVSLLQKAQVGNPGDARVRRMLALALSQQGSREQAISQLTSLLSDDPADAAARRALAEIYLAQGNFAGAEQLMREAPAGTSEDAGSEWLRAAILARSGKTGAALSAMERAAAAQKDNVSLQVELARAYLSAGRAADARQLLDQQPGLKLGVNGRSLQALTMVLGQSPEAAKSAISGWAAANAEDVAVQIVAGRYFQQAGDASAATTAYQRGRKAAPDNAEPALGLAEVALGRNDAAAAEATLRELVAQHPADERAYVALAIIARRQGKASDAEAWLRQSISANPAAVESRLQMAELAAARKDAALLKSMLSQAQSVATDKPATLMRAGEIQLAAGNATEALAAYDAAARLGSQPAILRAGAVEAAQQQFAAAMSRIAQYRKAGGSEASAEEYRGGVLMVQKKFTEAAAAFEASLKQRPASAVVAKLFAARASAGTPQPESVLKNWLDRNPADHPVRMLLADHLLSLKQYAAAAAQYEAIAKSAPASVVLNNLAWTYQQLKDSRAIDTARRAYESSGGDNPRIADTYGWLLQENGRTAEALPILKKAADALPDSSDVLGHYADALQASGASSDAAAVRARIKGQPGG